MAEDNQDEQYQKFRQDIRNTAYDQTQVAVKDRIAAEKDNIRNGGGFWGFLKGLLFKLVEFIDQLFKTNITGWLAKLSGTPIPETKDIQSLSGVVADSMSKAFIPETEEERKKVAAFKTGDEFSAYVSGRVLADLKEFKNKNPNTPFSEKDLEEAAKKAGEAAKAHFTEIQSLLNFDKKLAESLNSGISAEDRKNIAKLGGKDTLDDVDLNVMAGLMSTTMKKLAADKESLKAKGEGAFSHVASQIKESLASGKSSLAARGLDFSDEALTVIANEMALKATPQLLGPENVHVKPSSEFLKTIETGKLTAINKAVHSQVKAMVDETIKISTIESTLNIYDEQYFRSVSLNRIKEEGLYDKKDGAYKRKSSLKQKALTDDEKYWLEKSIYDKRNFTDLQRDKVAQIIADATVMTLNDEANQNKNQAELATELKINIRAQLRSRNAQLKDRNGEIDDIGKGFGHTVDVINKNNESNIFDKLAEGIEDKVKNDPAVFKQLDEARKAINAAKSPNAASSPLSSAVEQFKNGYNPPTPDGYASLPTNGNGRVVSPQPTAIG